MELLDQGQCELFMDPNPDKAREFFKNKNKKRIKKAISLKEAVDTYVHDGEYLAIGGFGTNRVPVAACHEIVRQGKKDMGFAGHTSSHDMTILSAGEVFNRLDVAYVIGLEARGLSPCSRKYVESGKVKVTEWTNYGMTLRFKAAAMGVPFLPARNMIGTDTFKYSAGRTAVCPFTGMTLNLLPALYPDVAFIHVHEADVYGNSRFKGISVADLDLAGAAKHLIITTERLVSEEEMKKDPAATNIPYHMVDAVCEIPYGGYPGNMAYEYFSDEIHLKDWLTTEKDPEAFKTFLDHHIYSSRNHEEYIFKNGGMSKMQALRNKELLLTVEEN